MPLDQQTGPAEDDLTLALTKRKDTSDAGEASAAKRPREREFEHQQRAVAATMAANSTSKEAAVWGKLKGKNKMMVKLRREFVEQFHAHGFGFVEGSKWVNMIDTETYSSRDSYKTEAQIHAAEAKCPEATAAKIETAKAMGQGVPPPGATLGWYCDPSRGGMPVYFYESNLEHESKMTREEGRCTRNTTGVRNATPSDSD